MKRDLLLANKIEEIINKSENLSDDERELVTELYKEYKSATYADHKNRHEFYRQMVSKMVNDFGFEDKELAQAMANEHPTLQQNFMRMVCYFIEEMANKKRFDDRNKGSVELAKLLDPIIKENRYLPCVKLIL